MSIYYRPEIIKLCRDHCLSLAMTNSTPKKYAAALFEAAEIIDQLQRELKIAQVEKEVFGGHADGTGGR